MKPAKRKWFDDHLAWVVARLPDEVTQKLDEVRLRVEDYPSAKVMEELGIEFREELCGYYTGVPLDERETDGPVAIPDTITVYRQGILAAAADDDGVVTDDRLREEIRITILHEFGHHHGMDEDDLDELGFG